MSYTSDLHQTLVEQGLDPFEGIPFEDVNRLQQDGYLTDIEAGLVSLTCPEWEQFKEFAQEVGE